MATTISVRVFDCRIFDDLVDRDVVAEIVQWKDFQSNGQTVVAKPVPSTPARNASPTKQVVPPTNPISPKKQAATPSIPVETKSLPIPTFQEASPVPTVQADESIEKFRALLSFLYKLSLKQGHAFHKTGKFDAAIVNEALEADMLKRNDERQVALSTLGYCFLMEHFGGTAELSNDHRVLRSLALSVSDRAFHPLIYALWDVRGHEVANGVRMSELNQHLGPFVGEYFNPYIRKALKKGIVDVWQIDGVSDDAQCGLSESLRNHMEQMLLSGGHQAK
jgi:hypothetical protein